MKICLNIVQLNYVSYFLAPFRCIISTYCTSTATRDGGSEDPRRHTPTLRTELV